MTKQKLIALIIKKESYKELKPTINQVGKQNTQSIKHSINAIQQILTKQYNAEAKLYALRFLKDCFQMGSKTFIKSTQQNLLPIITNIIVESTDQAAITKYAGSSFTKSTDLEKFKSIMVSFFKLAKQCVMKWAQWVSNPQYKFKAAYNSLQKKGIRFESQLKYFRPQNQVNFQKKCKENGFPIIILNRDSIKSSDDMKITKIEQQVQNPKPVTLISKPMEPNISRQKPTVSQSSVQQIKLSKRHGPKGKNSHILKCHQVFKIYDQKLKNGTMLQNDLQQMNSKINSQLEEYMGLPDLNQTQMESQLTPIFENIKNVKEDFANMKQRNVKTTLSIQSSSTKAKNPHLKKTEQLSSNKKVVETPQSPINQLKTPMKQFAIENPVTKFEDEQPVQDFEQQLKRQRMQAASQKKVETPKVIKQVKIEKKKVEVFEDDCSIMQSEVKPNPQINTRKQQKMNVSSTSSNNKRTIITTNNRIQQFQKQQISQTKSPKSNTQIQQSFTKNKSGTKQKFDSNLDFSHSEQSRVNFSESSMDDESSYDEGSKLTGNFKKEKTDLKLSSIVEQQADRMDNSSRRNISSELEQQSSLRRQPKQQDKIIEKRSVQSPQVKLPKHAIDDYENKIRALQNHLRQKQSRERQLQKRLTELNTLKRVQEEELEKIRVENNQILERFSNAVDPQEYARIKKDFEQMKHRNRKMEGNMDRLMKEIDELKVVQKQQHNQNMNILKTGNKENDLNQLPRQPNKLFQNTQNIPKQSSSAKTFTQPEKPKYTYHPIDPDYVNNRTHLSKLHEFLDQNNLTLLKKNIIGANELFFNSEEMSFICRTSPFNNQKLTLKLELSFKFNGLNKKDVKPTVTIPNIGEIQVWKKNLTGADFLYHQEIVVKLAHFPLNLLKLEVSTAQHMKKSVVLPFIYFSFLKKAEFKQQQFDSYFEQNKDSTIKSKVFNLVSCLLLQNTKVVKDFKSLHFYQAFSLSSQKRMCFKMYEQSQNHSFWCQLTNLSKQKCILKVIPAPYNQEMYVKAQQLMQNLIFLIGEGK